VASHKDWWYWQPLFCLLLLLFLLPSPWSITSPLPGNQWPKMA
jgi:hypothetical protein